VCFAQPQRFVCGNLVWLSGNHVGLSCNHISRPATVFCVQQSCFVVRQPCFVVQQPCFASGNHVSLSGNRSSHPAMVFRFPATIFLCRVNAIVLESAFHTVFLDCKRILQRGDRRMRVAKVKESQVLLLFRSLFLQASLGLFESLRDLADPPDAYASIASEKMRDFLIREQASFGTNFPKHLQREMFRKRFVSWHGRISVCRNQTSYRIFSE
jgi:hypothetical protein